MNPDIETGVADHPAARHAGRQIRSQLRQNWRPFYILLLIGVDVVSICLAGTISYALRKILKPVPATPPDIAIAIVLGSCILCIIIALLNGLYRSVYRMPFREQARIAVKVYMYSVPTILLGVYSMRGTTLPLRFSVIFLILIPFLFIAGRLTAVLANRYLHKKGYGWYNTMIVNWTGIGPDYPDRYAMFEELGYKVKAFACARAVGQVCTESSCALKNHFAEVSKSGTHVSPHQLRCYSQDELSKGIVAENIERLFVPLVLPVVSGFGDIVHSCMQHRVKLKVISRESEELLRFSKVRDIAGISLYSPPRLMTERIKIHLKTAFDIVGSLSLLLFFSPVFLLITLAILLEDGPPVFFRQERAAAAKGRRFKFLKFRSMVRGAADRQNEFHRLNETEGGLFRMQNDPRVTRVGRWLRMTSMDELPQLFNVFKGEMSLVGPRPLTLHDLQNISPDNEYADYYDLRSTTPPGITGLWQICGRRDVPFRDMVLLDLYYIENHSLAFDLEILFETIPVVLFGRGAY